MWRPLAPAVSPTLEFYAAHEGIKHFPNCKMSDSEYNIFLDWNFFGGVFLQPDCWMSKKADRFMFLAYIWRSEDCLFKNSFFLVCKQHNNVPHGHLYCMKQLTVTLVSCMKTCSVQDLNYQSMFKKLSLKKRALVFDCHSFPGLC